MMFIQVEHRNANWPLSVQARKNEQRSATEKMNEKKMNSHKRHLMGHHPD